jgi:hypothetical protein
MIEVRNDDRNLLDELVAVDAHVHLERMADHKWCLIVDDGDRRVMVSIGSPDRYRRVVNARIYANEPSRRVPV